MEETGTSPSSVVDSSASASVSASVSASTSTPSPNTAMFFPRNLSQSEMEELKFAFQLFDTERRGKISFSELKQTIHSIAMEEKNNEEPLLSLTSSSSSSLSSPSSSASSSSSSSLSFSSPSLSYHHPFKELLQILDQYIPKGRLKQDMDDFITEEEFIQLVTSRLQKQQEQQEQQQEQEKNQVASTAAITNNDHQLQRVFELFDRDQKGYITIEDLKRISIELGENMTDQELEQMIQRAATIHSTTPIHNDTDNDEDHHRNDRSGTTTDGSDSTASSSNYGKVTIDQLQAILNKKLFS